MKIAFIVFEDITWLDFIGIYDPITRLKTSNYLPNLEWQICSFSENAEDLYGLKIAPIKIRPDLSEFDAIIVSGGLGTRKLIEDQAFLTWIKTASAVKYKISVCTGSLILGAAGFLKDKTATTHFKNYPLLEPYCKNVSKENIVDDHQVITAGAVANSINLGLYLCQLWAGKMAHDDIKKQMGL